MARYVLCFLTRKKRCFSKQLPNGILNFGSLWQEWKEHLDQERVPGIVFGRKELALSISWIWLQKIRMPSFTGKKNGMFFKLNLLTRFYFGAQTLCRILPKKFKKKFRSSKVTILGVVALWGYFMAFPNNRGFCAMNIWRIFVLRMAYFNIFSWWKIIFTWLSRV